MVNDYIKKSYKARVVIERVRARTMLGRAIIGGVRVREEGTCIVSASILRTHRRVRPPAAKSTSPPTNHVRAGVVRVAEAVNARELARRHATDNAGEELVRSVHSSVTPIMSHPTGPRRNSASACQPGKARPPLGGPLPCPREAARHRFARNNGFFPPATFLLFAFCFFFASGNNRSLLFPLGAGGPSPTSLGPLQSCSRVRGPPGIISWQASLPLMSVCVYAPVVARYGVVCVRDARSAAVQRGLGKYVQ